jgi:hypothetical protein
VQIFWMLTESRYPPSAMIQAGLPINIVILSAKMCTLKSDKGMHKREKDAKGWSYLTDLHPMCGVAPCHWLVGVTSSRNSGHTLLLKSWSCVIPYSEKAEMKPPYVCP